MSGELYVAGNKIDGPSQKMLLAMREGDWQYATTLRKEADLNDNRQVTYRMERYLCPAKLVVESTRESEKDGRWFRLTDAGTAWVENHSDELLAPTTREEIVEAAHEGRKEGNSAKNSVQNYRQKLSRTKSDLDDVRETVDDIADQQHDNAKELNTIQSLANNNQTLVEDNNSTLDELADAVAARATNDKATTLENQLSALQYRQQLTERAQAELARQQATTHHERAQLRSLAQPAGYLALAALATYLIGVVLLTVLAPGIATTAFIAGIVALLALAAGGGAALYANHVRLAVAHRDEPSVSIE